MTLMMKHKQSYFLGGSFALVLFMMLGYLVKFYPADLVRIDADIQIALRADLPRHCIAFLPTLGMKSISLSMFLPSLLSFMFGRNGRWKLSYWLVTSC